jgi:hypothetical protein
MKYYTFQLDWTDSKEGTDPSTIVNVNGVRLEPTFSVGEEPNATHYAYLISGQLELEELTQWKLTEVTFEDTLTAALTINSDAYSIDGKIHFPAGDIFRLM